ncbi:hypothetical protein [Rhizobium sp. BK176]|uniref:hypothetical protein n=1 Tax=Rhizobium sp. BK176 TaxID=2587071 RepID=UPI002167EC1A|nr:hypothetical protein [Rhizobium sp. BK176]MCS4089584.1 hypothetical protein [Rhizobium sp. BK176]
MSSVEFHSRLIAGEDDLELRRIHGHMWLEHLALSFYYFEKFNLFKGIKHGLNACGGFGSGVQGLSRVLGPTTVVLDRQLLVRHMQAYLDSRGKSHTLKPDTDFKMFDCMTAALMADALPPLKAIDSGDLELTASLFSKFVEAVPAGMGFVYLPKPKAKGGIDLDLIKPALWRRVFRGEVIGREISGDQVWAAVVQHMAGRVESASLLTDRCADELAASLEHLKKRAPFDLKREFGDMATRLSNDRKARADGGPWGMTAN